MIQDTTVNRGHPNAFNHYKQILARHEQRTTAIVHQLEAEINILLQAVNSQQSTPQQRMITVRQNTRPTISNSVFGSTTMS